MQPRQMRETSRPVRPSLVYFIVYPSQLRASCEVRDDIRREEFVGLDVVPVIAVDQQVHTGVLILADQIDGLGHCAHKTPQRSALSQPLTLRRHSGLVAAEQPAVIVGRFNRNVVTPCGVAMLTKYRKLVPHRFRITADVVQASARRATARNVSCSPPPAIITGGRGFWTGFGSRIAPSTWKYRPWNVVRGSDHIFRINSIASSICRMRIAGRGGNAQPYCLYSSSKKPAPTPSVSRPRLMRSTLAAILARCAGLR